MFFDASPPCPVSIARSPSVNLAILRSRLHQSTMPVPGPPHSQVLPLVPKYSRYWGTLSISPRIVLCHVSSYGQEWSQPLIPSYYQLG